MVVKNADAIERALRAGDRRVKDSLGRYGDAILRDFRLSVSVPYPPPSAPGTPPHLRTGEYRLALAVKKRGTAVVLYARTNAANSLATWLEWGTHRNGRPFMLPRPHWRTVPAPSALAHRDIITRALLAGERSWRRTQ
jgi:hypothetical protein